MQTGAPFFSKARYLGTRPEPCDVNRRFGNHIDIGEHTVTAVEGRRRASNNLDPLHEVHIQAEVLLEEVVGIVNVLCERMAVQHNQETSVVISWNRQSADSRLCEVDHAEAGRWLLSQWGCPIELQNVAAWHESPPQADTCDRPLISLVHTASRLADLMKMSVFPSAPLDVLPEVASELPPLARAEVLANFPEIAEWVAIEVNGIEQAVAAG